MALDGISNTVKAGAAIIGAIAVIVGTYKSVEAWAQGLKDDTQQQIAVSEAKQALIHDLQFQTNRAESNEAKLRIAELELAQLEDDAAHKESQGIEPAPRELRAIERLEEQISVFDKEAQDARENIRQMESKK